MQTETKSCLGLVRSAMSSIRTRGEQGIHDACTALEQAESKLMILSAEPPDLPMPDGPPEPVIPLSGEDGWELMEKWEHTALMSRLSALRWQVVVMEDTIRRAIGVLNVVLERPW